MRTYSVTVKTAQPTTAAIQIKCIISDILENKWPHFKWISSKFCFYKGKQKEFKFSPVFKILK